MCKVKKMRANMELKLKIKAVLQLSQTNMAMIIAMYGTGDGRWRMRFL